MLRALSVCLAAGLLLSTRAPCDPNTPAPVEARASTLAPGPTLAPGSTLRTEVDEAGQEFGVTLDAGTAATLTLTQERGFVDLELRALEGTLAVRTEAGVGGRIDARLVAAEVKTWRVSVAARKGKGRAQVTLQLTGEHGLTNTDRLDQTGFEHYVLAEQLRRENYRETVVTHRAADIDAHTRAEYSAAEHYFMEADDACAVRRTRIGSSRMEEALGNHSRARLVASAALAVACDGDLAERAQALKTIGMAAAYQADYSASADAAEQALALYEQTGDLRYQGIVLGNLSEVYMQLGATGRALEAAQGALRAAQSTADSQGVVFSQKSIAAIHLARGELASALQAYRETLKSLETTPYPMIEGETWNDLGILHHRMGDYSGALDAFAKAQIVWQNMHYRVGAADTLIDNGQLLLELEDTRQAALDFSRALEIARTDGLRRIEARALRSLGSVDLALDRMASARRYFTQAVAVARSIGEVAEESYALRSIADLDFRQRRVAAARVNDAAALRWVRRAGDRNGEAATLAQIARHAAASGHLTAAKSAIDAALSIVETQRGQINDPSLRTSFFSSMRSLSDDDIDILMRLDERHPGAGYDRAALEQAERARARALQDGFAERAFGVTRGVSADLVAEQRAAEDRLNAAALSLSRAGAHASVGRLRELGAAVDAASRSLDEVRGEIRGANPRYADLVQPLKLDLGEVRSRLPGTDTAVLEYWLGSRMSYVWIVTQGSLRAVRLAPRPRIEVLAQQLLQLLQAPADAAGGGFDALALRETEQRRAIDRAAAQLGRELLGADVLEGLPGRLGIVADGGLMQVPFGLLPSDDQRPALGANHDVSYLPSMSTLKWLRRHAAGEVAAPAVAIFAAPLVPSTTSPRDSTAASVALPSSRAEAEAIAAFVPKEREWLALGAQANRASVMAADWRRFSIAHFATHAIVDRRRPELSNIVLSQVDDAGNPEDGALHMYDIYNLDMPVDLVVLSGCDTAGGHAVESEGVFSLSRAFLYAGARQVVASLWPVEDRATAAFMQEFYRGLLRDHRPVADALRLAQQRLASEERWSSPYYWGGFVVQGALD